jgi:hypothetical protein
MCSINRQENPNTQSKQNRNKHSHYLLLIVRTDNPVNTNKCPNERNGKRNKKYAYIIHLISFSLTYPYTLARHGMEGKDFI